MSIAKRGGWMLVGAIVGALATTSVSAVREQAQSPVAKDRLTVTLATTNVGSFAFVKDTKSEGCWLVITKETGVSIASAPGPACR